MVTVWVEINHADAIFIYNYQPRDLTAKDAKK